MFYEWADHQLFGAGDGALLFGVDQGSLFAIDGATRDTLTRWRDRPALDLENVLSDDRDILEGLRDIRMLVPVGTPHRLPAVLPDIASVPLTTMVLEVAQECNLRCTYCYADGGGYGQPARLMDEDTVRTAVRLLFNGSGIRETVTLVLFGGEPLLNMTAVRTAVAEAEAAAGETGKKVVISLTTNGTLLDREIIDFIHNHKIAVALSLDGPVDLHDTNRPFAGGNGSYAGIVARLKPLLAGATAPVAARVTLTPDQWHRVEEVFFHLLQLGCHEVGIAPASPVRQDLLPDRNQEEALFRGFAALASAFVVAANTGRILPFSNMVELLGRLHRGETKAISCGAGYGYLAVDAGGSFYICHRLSGEESFHVGDIASGADAVRIRSALEAVTCGRGELCNRCWARTLCAGGCHYENHLRENRLEQSPGGSCDFIRTWFRTGMEVYAELRRSGADAIIERVGKRPAC